MLNLKMEQTTSLKTKVFESSLKWNIENFLEYSDCDIETVNTRTISIEGSDAHWTLSVHPKGYNPTATPDEDFVSLSLQIKDQNPSENHYFKFEVRVEPPCNRHHIKPDGMYAQQRELKPVAWINDYEKIGKRTSLELYKEKFINVHDVPPYLCDGTLRLKVDVSMKCMDIVEAFKKIPI